MLSRISTPKKLITLIPIKYQFSSVSWKRIHEKIRERQKYYQTYEMQSNSIKIENQNFKLYLSPRSPQVVRTQENQYVIQKQQYNFNMTFLNNLDFMGKDFTWNNRKMIGLSLRDIFQMEKVQPQNPVTIQKESQSSYENDSIKLLKKIKIQVSQSYQVRISFEIFSQSDNDKWSRVYEMSFNDYQYLVQSAKKNVYYLSGLKTQIQLQKRQIIYQMDKRVLKDRQKPLKSKIVSELDDQELLKQMQDFQEQVESKGNKKRKPSSKTSKNATK